MIIWNTKSAISLGWLKLGSQQSKAYLLCKLQFFKAEFTFLVGISTPWPIATSFTHFNRSSKP